MQVIEYLAPLTWRIKVRYTLSKMKHASEENRLCWTGWRTGWEWNSIVEILMRYLNKGSTISPAPSLSLSKV